MRDKRRVVHATFVLILSLNSAYMCGLNIYVHTISIEGTGFALRRTILKCV